MADIPRPPWGSSPFTLFTLILLVRAGESTWNGSNNSHVTSSVRFELASSLRCSTPFFFILSVCPPPSPLCPSREEISISSKIYYKKRKGSIPSFHSVVLFGRLMFMSCPFITDIAFALRKETPKNYSSPLGISPSVFPLEPPMTS